MQANGTSFETPEALLRSVQLYDLTQQTLHHRLEVLDSPIAM